MNTAAGFIVRCKCAIARVDEMNEFVQAAFMGSYPHSPFERVEKEYYRGETFTRTVTYFHNADFRCLSCGYRFKIVEIRGTVKPEHKCDARCMASKGPTCECACGGKNHGGSWR